ncbi:MAG TPA: hypothetical protein PKK66_02705 [Bacteroidales bacterium]|jgi:hypothetical protein|nr:hypothetical protein [Bacteroidales bacterium]MDD4395470.1 hypothetical protein [Bacteroidales bacterium]HNW67743.1 hypothetical protein [Bacteroidales bacterium]HPT52483.1 hypothetical protein [Bacteroidales bacterium]
MIIDVLGEPALSPRATYFLLTSQLLRSLPLAVGLSALTPRGFFNEIS